MPSRVGSPSAAKTSAAPATVRSMRGFDMLLQPDDDFRPAPAVVGEHFRTAGERDPIESGFRDGDARPRSGGFESERDGGSRLARVVDLRIDFSRVPFPDD